MAKKNSSHKWFVGTLMWLGILSPMVFDTYDFAFLGIGIALAYMIYYVHG